MLGDEKMQPGFVDFPNVAQGFGFVSREAISEAREFSKKPTRWNFARAVTWLLVQRCFDVASSESVCDSFGP